MKLELTLPALERLIGGDTEIEIGIRHQIVEAFVKRHIKPLVNDSTWQNFYAKWRDELMREINTLAAKFQADLQGRQELTPGCEPHWSLRSLIEKTAGPIVDKIVSEKVKEYDNVLWGRIIKGLEKLLANEAVQLIRQQVDNLINTAVAGRMNELVEAEIQRRLKLAQEAVRAV